MKRRSKTIVTATVVAILLLSTIGAGAAAAGSEPSTDDGMSTDTIVFQAQNVTQSSDMTTSTGSLTGDESDDTSTAADTILESIDTDLQSSLEADDGLTFLEDLFDDLGGDDDSETDSDGDDSDDGSETDDGTDDTDGADDSTGENGDTGEDSGDDSVGESDDTDDDAGSNETAGDETDADGLDRAQVERYVHEAVNDERTARGLEPLSFDTELRDIARSHSEDMAERGYFSHVDPEGNDFADRYDAAGYECNANGYAGGENLAQTWYDTRVATGDGDVVRYETERELADGIVTQWMNSPGHRENLLASQWENEGIGVAVTDDNRVYVTQNFC